MGGSNLGARLVASIYAEQLTVPMLIEPGYNVPKYIDKQTLYIISSYSGTTEEPLSVIKEVQRRGAQIAVITADHSNNPLTDLARRHNWPACIFTPTNNPFDTPRLGLGYAIFGLLGLLANFKILDFNLTTTARMIHNLRDISQHWLPETPTINNDAKQLAVRLHNRQFLLIGPDNLTGNLHILRNQINESGKNLAYYLTVPELNHYALEGLSFPKNIPKIVAVLSFKITGLSKQMNKRLELTDKIFKQNHLPVFNYNTAATNHLEQALEILSFGSWLSYYLGLLNGVDPVKIPWVNLFKKKLA